MYTAPMFDQPSPKRLLASVLARPDDQPELSDEEFELYQRFIINTMIGSEWETTDYHRDYCPFEKLLRKSFQQPVPWERLYELHLANQKAWPIWESSGEKCLIAWTQCGSLITEWVEFTPDALSNNTIELKIDPRTKKLALEEGSILGLATYRKTVLVEYY